MIFGVDANIGDVDNIQIQAAIDTMKAVVRILRLMKTLQPPLVES